MSSVVNINPTGEVTDFLDYLYGNQEGYVYSPTKDSDTGAFSQHFFKWPEQRKDLVTHILTSTQDSEVYTAPAIFSRPSISKDSFATTRVLWTEFDGVLPTDFKGIPMPTLRVQSSDVNHQHCYWLLDEPLTDALEVEAYNRTLAYQLNADASAWDVVQVLRPPSTTNHKRERQVMVVGRDDSPIQIDRFEPTYPTIELSDINPDVIPDVADIVYKYPFPTEVTALFKQPTLPVGDRSTSLMRLGYYAAEMGMSDPEIFSILRNADDRWGKFKGRTDRNQRIIDLIGRVREKYPATDFQADVIPVFGFESFLEHDVEVEWVIPGLLQEQGYMLLVGPSGVGKTQFSLRVALAMALGKNWLGFDIEKPRKILMFSLEMGHADLKYFVNLMASSLTKEERELLETNLIFVPYGEPIYLDKAEGKDQFLTILEAVQPDGVIIDSVGSTTAGGISNEETVKAIMDFNDKIRKSHRAFTWWIHHMRKAQGDNKKPNKLSDVYGNQYLANRATSVYCLWPNHNKIEVIPLKKRLAKMEDTWAVTRVGNLDFERTSVVSVISAEQAAVGEISAVNTHQEKGFLGDF